MNYHIGRLVLSSLCAGAFGAAGFRQAEAQVHRGPCIIVIVEE